MCHQGDQKGLAHGNNEAIGFSRVSSFQELISVIQYWILGLWCLWWVQKKRLGLQQMKKKRQT